MMVTKSEEAAPKAAKPKVGKAPAAAKSEAAANKPAAKKESAPKAPSKAKDADGFVKVTQLVGCIGRRHDQEATLKGLGLNKRHRSKVLENTPSVRGMIYKVRHLVKTEKA